MPTPHILLLSEDQDRLASWAQGLAARGCRVWMRSDELPEGISLDVIVTDRVPDESTAEQFDFASTSDVGLIAVGTSRAADVSLPGDCSLRELQLACTLLAEVVSLRRLRRSADRASQSLRALTLTDPLTGLPNRRAWDEELQSRAGESRTSGRSLCLALLDLDHFKAVNDRCGHQRGDEALKAAGQALASRVRKDDFAARLGGDEFGLLLWDLPPVAAKEVVERIRRGVGDLLGKDLTLSLSASTGYVVTAGVEHGGESLFSLADMALCEAKRAGRDCTRGRQTSEATRDLSLNDFRSLGR